MSQLTRLASTNEQEEAIADVEQAFKRAQTRSCGHTTIGKSPQTVILDVHYQDSAVYVNSRGEITIKGRPFCKDQIADMAEVISEIKQGTRQSAACLEN
jgi:hypothetical protein